MTLYVSAPTNWMEARRQMLRKMLEHENDENCGCALSFPVDIITSDSEYLIKALLPGLKTDAVNIQYNNNVLTIEGEYKFESDEDEKYILSEIPEGKFSRSFELKDSVDVEKIEANMLDGVLTVRIPKAAEARPRTIKISNN